MKIIAKFSLMGLMAALLSACGGGDLTCDEVQYYQLAEERKRVETPDDLDDLDPLREMTVPEPSPREERAAGSTCFDRPPEINLES